ncbi:hypothetical protein Tco_1561255 [Tanacetum coccineum]
MANQEKNPPQQEQPFVAAKQVVFNLEDILLNTNNKVALLYPEHNNKDYFKCDLISFPNAALENHLPNHLTWVNTFRNAIGAHYLPDSNEYVAPPSINVVRQWFLTIGYEEEVSAKGTLYKSLLPPRWSLANGINIDYANIFWEDIIIKLKKKQREKVLKPNQPEEPPFTDHMLAICAADKLVVFKASKTSSKAESVSQAQSLELKLDTRSL